jgi:hypothetical protein
MTVSSHIFKWSTPSIGYITPVDFLREVGDTSIIEEFDVSSLVTGNVIKFSKFVDWIYVSDCRRFTIVVSLDIG